MDRKRALDLLRGGSEAVARWNRWRSRGEPLPDLRHSDLRRADLRGANLASAHLQRSNFGDARLEGANLERADLNHCNFRRADLSGATLRSVNLSGANLKDADLRGADLRRAQIRRASFFGVRRDAETRPPEGRLTFLVPQRRFSWIHKERRVRHQTGG